MAKRRVTCIHDGRALTLGYRHGEFRRSVTVASSSPAAITRAGFAFSLQLAPGEQWSTTFTISPFSAQPGIVFSPRKSPGPLADLRKAKAAEIEAWLADAPVLQSDDLALMHTYRASLADLTALRMRPDLTDSATLPAAGLPWFMALVRSRQPDRQLPGAPLPPGTRRHDAARAGSSPGAGAETTSMSGSPGRSCTSTDSVS